MKLVTTLILNIIFTALAVLLARQYLPGIELENFKAAFIVAGILSVASWLVGWVLHRTTAPSTFLLGLISFIGTSFFVYLISHRYDGFTIDTFLTALLLTAALTLVQIGTGVKRG